METILTKEQVIEIAKANYACEEGIDIYKNFNGSNKEFANQYPYETLWICRVIPNFVDEQTFLLCCKKDVRITLLYCGKELLEKDFAFFKELALTEPYYALVYCGEQLLEKKYDLFKELTLKEPLCCFGVLWKKNCLKST